MSATDREAGSPDPDPRPRLNQMAIPLWLDCDPGHDDAMAIILAGESERALTQRRPRRTLKQQMPLAGWDPTSRVQLLGLSTVAGNQTVEKCTRNALDVLHVAGITGIGRLPPHAQTASDTPM